MVNRAVCLWGRCSLGNDGGMAGEGGFPQSLWRRGGRGSEKGLRRMASATTALSKVCLFDYEHWRSGLPALAQQYRSNQPYPHLHLESFLQPEVARELMREFPDPDSHDWIQYKHRNENKLGLPKRESFPSRIGQVVDELNSPRFVAWLSELTGIEGLVSDETLEGGGLHQSSRGGFLNVHADFTMHHHRKNWRRRVNLILYLNEGWKPEWGGAIELWNRDMTRCDVRVEPELNHALIFNTDEHSYHGFPDRLACPAGVSRKSLALYYYTPEGHVQGAGKSTNYRARPTDGWFDAILIWLDKKAVHVYSRSKEALGLSDDFASRVLGFFSRKR